MNKKIWIMLWTAILWASSILTPMLTTAQWWAGQWWFWQQRWTKIWVAGWQWDMTSGNEGFLDFINSAINRILALLGLIAIVILIWGGFQMVTAAWDDNKYKKWFTIVKQAVIGLILIGVSALIINLIFSFVNTNTATAWTTGG